MGSYIAALPRPCFKKDNNSSNCYCLVVAIEASTMNSIAFYPVWAQQTTSNSTNMTSIMMDSTRLHLNTARNALMNGTTKAASDQITKAQMQLSMLHMKSMGTMNEMQALSFMRPGGAERSTSKMVRELHYPS